MSRQLSNAAKFRRLLVELGEDAGANPRIVPVVVETPKLKRNKYAFNGKIGAFTLSAVLPAGMSFPYDFGFIPYTLGEDGDPLDVLLLLDEPAFTGCLLGARLLGVLEGLQTDKGEKPLRNDRLIAVATESHTHRKITTVKEIDKQLRAEIENFFSDYHAERGSKFKPLSWRGSGSAVKLLKVGRRMSARGSQKEKYAIPGLCEVPR